MNIITNKTLETLKYDLVREGLVQYEVVEQAEEIANAQNINIGQALINSGFITEEKLIKFLESKLHTPFVNLDDYQLDPNCLKYINYSDARRYKIIPLFKIENTLTVAMADPRDLFAIDKIMETAECEIDPVLSSEESILKKIDEFYKIDADKIDFDDFTNAIPAFVTFLFMPLMGSIGDGIIFGILSYTILKLATNKRDEVNISMIILSILFIIKFILLG